MGNAHTKKKPGFDEALVDELAKRWTSEDEDLDALMRRLDEQDFRKRVSMPKHLCNECRQVVESADRYHCSECSDYDVCGPCMAAGRAHWNPETETCDLPDHIFSLDRYTPRDVHDSLLFVKEIQNRPGPMLRTCLESYSDRRCWGWRDRATGEPRWEKFRTVLWKVDNATRGLHSLKLEKNPSQSKASPEALTQSQLVMQEPEATICIIGNNRPEWILADFAGCLSGNVVAPLYPTMSGAILTQLLRENGAWIVFCDVATCCKLDNEMELPNLKCIVLFEGPEKLERLEKRPNVCLMEWTQFLTYGENAMERPIAEPDVNDLFTIIYTSGSTGLPKGVMHSYRSWAHGLTHSSAFMNDPHVQVSFAPLAHSSARRFVWQTVGAGGRTFFIDDDNYPSAGYDKFQTIVRECHFANPTVVSSTPRFWNALHSQYLSELLELGKDKTRTKTEVEKELVEKYRNMLGWRLRLAVIGGGSSSKELQGWMFHVFQVIVNNGWGASESGGIASGPPGQPLVFAPGCSWRVRSVPELGYDANGDPPMGELLVKTPTLSLGYFKRGEQTRAAFQKDGYFATGDIVRVEKDGKSVVIIDRAKNFIKLQQGEFVQVERLESLYNNAPAVEQIIVHADPLKNFVVAIVVPVERLRSASDSHIETQVLRDIARVAVEHELQGFEVPRGAVITRQEWTAHNGLLTGTNKPDRRAVVEKFAAQLQDKYAELENVSTRLEAVLKEVMGDMDMSAAKSKTFSQLGGDSLRAMRLQKRVENETGVVIPIQMVLGGATTVEEIGEYVQSQVASDGTLVQSSKALDVAALCDASKWTFQATSKLAVVPMECTFFLTGATGFLGLHTLKALLDVGAKRVICLVRGKDGPSRLKAKAKAALMDLDFGCVTIVRGDIAEERLGLSDEDFQLVGREANIVVHCAALVNSLFTLDQLVPSNAESVRWCIELCADPFPPKRLLYVSTAGALYPFAAQISEEPVKVDERRLPWEPWLERAAGGYTGSKLIGENIVYAAMDKGLSARIVRPSSISPHPLTGHFNDQDTFSRIIAACVIQQSCPSNVEAHTINLINVQWCAQATVVAATAAEPFPEILHLTSAESTSWSLIFRWLRDYELDMKELEFEEWSHMLQMALESTASIEKSQMGNHAHPLQGLMHRFRANFPYFGDLYSDRISNSKSNAALGGCAPDMKKREFFSFVKLLSGGKF